jgi:formylglycine-generating enzyme required for sulfatase activity
MPVAGVSFEDAQAFAAWRSKREGVTYRLPTEDEWEYVARNGDQNDLYPWGNAWVGTNAVTKEAGVASPQPVGSFQSDKTRWGVYDVMGNVREWTSSKASFYQGNKNQVPVATRDWIIVRGGSFVSDHREIPISATYRDWFAPATKHPTIGFRLVRVQQ